MAEARGDGRATPEECLIELLRLGERLDLVIAAEAPAHLSSRRGFTHASTRPYQAPFDAALGARNFVEARRVLTTAVASLREVIAKRLAAGERRRRESRFRKTPDHAICSVCGGRGPAMAGRTGAICSSCATEATAFFTDSSRTGMSRKPRSRRTRG